MYPCPDKSWRQNNFSRYENQVNKSLSRNSFLSFYDLSKDFSRIAALIDGAILHKTVRKTTTTKTTPVTTTTTYPKVTVYTYADGHVYTHDDTDEVNAETVDEVIVEVADNEVVDLSLIHI